MNHKAAFCHSMRARGFTLIEIAIVIVIIGLILGGVLKGQELIRTARTHNVADQGSAIKAAILGFTDRFQALPGDYKKASEMIPGVVAGQNGDGNSRVGYDDSAVPGKPDENNRLLETGLVWLHLTKAGFATGAFNGKPLAAGDLANWTCSADTCLVNAYNAPLIFVYANEQTGVSWAADMLYNNQLWSGKNLPVEILAELDRKQDDGNPSTGNLRAGDGFVEGGRAVGSVCATGGQVPSKSTKGVVSEGTPFSWDVKGQAPNCGAVLLF